MPSIEINDDDDFNIESPNGSSDNDQDDPMEDADDLDGDGDMEIDLDADADGDGEDEADENEDEDDQEEVIENPRNAVSKSGEPNVATNEGGELRSPVPNNSAGKQDTNIKSPLFGKLNGSEDSSTRLAIRSEAIAAASYDIAPTIAAPHCTSINALTSTPDLKWVFSGGSDGYIRKFNWVDTVNGKLMLTVAQRHPFVDSVTKAGVLMSYWENEEPAESGGINLQSVRHDEGKRITCLKQHTSAVSVLNLAPDEKSLLSGSWDRNIFDWDLDTGKVRRGFIGSGGQISAIEPRPLSDLSVPSELATAELTSDTFADSAAKSAGINGSAPSTDSSKHSMELKARQNGTDDPPGSPTDSLFGGKEGDSLFGDDDEATGLDGPSDGTFDYDNDISRAIETERRQQNEFDDQQETAAINDAVQPSSSQATVKDSSDTIIANTTPSKNNATGLPTKIGDVTSEGSGKATETTRPTQSEPARSGIAQTSDTTFVAASMDGTLRLWDRRQSNPVATIAPPRNVPPWCMNACWSPDGNFIYAGRRNGTVEEYNLHKGLRQPERTFRFPQGSGPVSAVRAMPNGRHLIW
ncbi:MAG: Transcription factor spt8 [Vezdaea aestivalis]|nr:MAG: Transcription factor spt8 [Vezdaea aestivalis]